MQASQSAYSLSAQEVETHGQWKLTAYKSQIAELWVQVREAALTS